MEVADGVVSSEEGRNKGAMDRRKNGTHFVGVAELQINGSTDF